MKSTDFNSRGVQSLFFFRLVVIKRGVNELMSLRTVLVSIAVTICCLVAVFLVVKALSGEDRSFDITKSSEVDVKEVDGKLVFNEVDEELAKYGESLKPSLEQALGEGNDDEATALLTLFNRFAFESALLLYRECYDSFELSLDEDTETLTGLYNSMINSVESQNEAVMEVDERFTELVQTSLREYYGEKSVTSVTFEENVFDEVAEYYPEFDCEEYCQMLKDTGYALALAIASGDDRIGEVETEQGLS